MSGILLYNALIAGGDGTPAFPGDLVLRDGVISEIRPRQTLLEKPPLALPPGLDRVIDAGGLTVTPGFIDIHRHDDLAPFTHAGEEELRQGITSFINGNCGFSLSPAPSAQTSFQDLCDWARPILGEIPPRFGTPGRNFQALREDIEGAARTVGLWSSPGYLTGGGTLRIAVKGFDPGPFSSREMDMARGLLADELDAGSFGLSLGLMYAPESNYSQAELARLCAVPAGKGRPVTVHLWGEGRSLIPSVERITGLAKKTGGRFHISHLKAAGRAVWHTAMPRVLDLLREARAAGLGLSFDVYPYCAGSTALYTLLPPDLQRLGMEAMLKALEDPAVRGKAAAELREEQDSWDNLVPGVGWGGVTLAEAPYTGLTIEEIAAERRVSGEDCLFDLILESRGRFPMIINSICEEDMKGILSEPGAVVISDSLYPASGLPHPRRFGAQARFLSRYSPLLGGFHKALPAVTSLPASLLGLGRRGLIREGFAADLLLLDLPSYRDAATFEDPRRYPEGIEAVFAAGHPAFTRREGLLRRAGRLITPSEEGGA